MESTIRAYQTILKGFRPSGPLPFPEDFAVKRFFKKFEVPSDHKEDLRAKSFNEWLTFDRQLPHCHLPPGEWYTARLDLRQVRPCTFRTFDFPKGSEVVATRGFNSLQSRLERSVWTVTRDAFEAFASIVYHHKGLKRAFRKRYQTWYARRNFDLSMRQSDRFLYRKLGKTRYYGLPSTFVWKLSRIVSFVEGSRFSTVPKNNSNDRPINIEPFGNLVVQRSIGIHLRSEIKRLYGIDLDTLQDDHVTRISSQCATIDLKNASDAVTQELVSFLFPKPVSRQLFAARSPMVLGLDGNYHLTKKISSMGNGFTFELMSLILLACTRQLDSTSSVFGDDIIINPVFAPRLVHCLERVGFIVNSEKSFIDGPFRESCGGNFHDDYGYIKSFDFEWPTSLRDCVIIHNKAKLLSEYPSFKDLYSKLTRVVPIMLRSGVSCQIPSGFRQGNHQPKLEDMWFATAKRGPQDQVPPQVLKRARKLADSYQYESFTIFRGLSHKPKEASRQLRHLPSKAWAKYEMYLDAGRRTKDVRSGFGSDALCWYINFGAGTMRIPRVVD